MEAASLNEIKKELANREPEAIIALCLRMARYKKENKELLSYLLFESEEEQNFIDTLRQEIDNQFDAIIYGNTYRLTKQIRKILRYVNKHIKYSGLPATQVELLMHFCGQLLPIVKEKRNQTALVNVYSQQIKKIQAALGKMHEDLQYDYIREMEKSGLIWTP